MPILKNIFALLIFVGLLVATAMVARAKHSWKTWFVIRLALQRVKTLARQKHVKVKVTWFGAIDIDPGYLSIWIRTLTDSDRDTLVGDTSFDPAIRTILRGAGYPLRSIPSIHITIESQQTVDRDLGGSWFALRNKWRRRQTFVGQIDLHLGNCR